MANAFAFKPERIVGALASSTAAGYDPNYVANDQMGVVWKSNTGSASQTLTVVLDDYGHAIDTVLIFGMTGAQAAWTLTVDAMLDDTTTLNASGGNAGLLAGATFPTHGRGVGYWAGSVLNSGLKVYRLTFGNLSGAAVTVGRVALGSRMQLERNFAFGGGWGLRDLGNVDFSPQGVMLRRRAARLRTLGLTFPNVRKDEVEARVQPLIELAGAQEPIVLVTDSAADTMRQKRCYFGPMIGDLGTIWRARQSWEWRANLVDLVPIPKGL
jgi:hypothetical protein